MALLHLRQFEAAERCLLKAASLCTSEVPVSLDAPSRQASHKVVRQGSVEHYLSIIRCFDRCGQPRRSLDVSYAALVRE